jgi:DNA-binding NtrC family response regulator
MRTPEMKSSRRYRIIILDDNEKEAAELQMLVGRDDIDVALTSTLREAIDILRKTHIHLVIMDIVLGDGDSLDILDYIREAASETRTIVISQHPYRLDIMRRLRQADEVLSKPVNPTTFAALIDRLLPQPGKVPPQ